MPDVKISALPSATTPLAGTEVLPIVQGGATDQVSVANLTAGRTVAAAGLTVDANSAGNAVRITQTGAGNALVVEDSASPDATPFVVDASGKVKVLYSTDWPSFTTPALGIDSNQSAAFGTNWYGYNNSQPIVSFVAGGGTAFGDNASVASGRTLGVFRWYGTDGTAPVIAAAISAAVDGTPGTGDMPGRLVFSTTTDGTSTLTERMRITNAGSVGIGVAPAADVTLNVGRSMTGGGQNYALGIISVAQVQSGVTSFADGIRSSIGTAAASFTLSSLRQYYATQGSFGAGSTVTSQFGFHAESTLVGATNNYGFYGNIPSGTGRWNFYAAGTADNYFAGNVGIGTTTPVNKLQVNGSFGRGAPVTKTGNFTLADTENWVICNGTGSITVTLPAASSWTGREVMIKTIAAQTVVSNASNVVPIDGSAAGTAILAATAGKWATLVSDGTNWVIMQAN